MSSLHSINEDGSVESIPEPNQKIPSNSYLSIFGSCNGLLLIWICDHLFLWNPLTRCSTKVLSFRSNLDYSCGVVSGLCIDSSSNEYKAVLYCPLLIILNWAAVKVGAEVRFPYRVLKVNSGPVVNENLQWCASNATRDHLLVPHQIIYFNPQMNKFNNLPMPQPKDGGGDFLFGLGVLEGCLCMLRCCEYPSNRVDNIQVLAMKEYGMQKSWSTMFVISDFGKLPVYDELAPLCCTKNGKVIMNVDGNFIKAYNPIDNSLKDIRISHEDDCFSAIVYEESLVTPSDYNWEEEELRGESTCVKTSFSEPWQRIVGTRVGVGR